MKRLTLAVTPRELRMIVVALGWTSADFEARGDLPFSSELLALARSFGGHPVSDSKKQVTGSLFLKKGSSRGSDS